MTDTELYEYINDVVRREQLFLNTVCDRQTLIERFHLSEKRIGAAFSLGSGLTDFVRETRIQYACWLFNNYPEMTISEVSKACGFSSLPVFSREFKRKLEVTPTYYRSQL